MRISKFLTLLFVILLFYLSEIYLIKINKEQLRQVNRFGYESEKIITYNLNSRKINADNLSFISLSSRTDLLANTKQISEILSKKTTEYSGKVIIGNPSQEFEMVFDTGSANFIITSSKCESSGCTNHNKYYSENSKSSRIIDHLSEYNDDYVPSNGKRDEVHIRFGTGFVKCLMTQDKVCIGRDGSICSDNLLMLEAYFESQVPFSEVKFDGIIGLSFSHLSVNSQSNFIDVLVKEKKITQKVFSFYFNKNDDKQSQISIGGIEMKKFTGDIYFSEVISRNYWEIKIDAIYYGNIKLDFCNMIICSAVVDTGTSMLAGPQSLMQTLEYYSYVKSDCSNFDILQNIKFEINGKLFNLDPEFYVMKIKYDQNSNNTKVECINAFMNMDALSNPTKTTLLLGSPFLKKYYTVFDRENLKIGFALAKH
jgi:hypothetical protein